MEATDGARRREHRTDGQAEAMRDGHGDAWLRANRSGGRAVALAEAVRRKNGNCATMT